MISDEKLVKISLLIAILGVAMIYLSIALIGPQSIVIGDISKNDTGKQVTLSGTVNSYSIVNGNIFITLGDVTGNITVVMFERTARGQKEVYELKENELITVDGQINVYKNELEIIANKITLVQVE
ncbi:MAG: exodeoxyribonuclease VII large subunit [Candidatus Aenigmarchaeota archaeon]|nr:exodeoxyribonuclease VII large subunit [Candidatus Aenigmarchaeota archaeon]